jgi:hypothetical protein
MPVSMSIFADLYPDLIIIKMTEQGKKMNKTPLVSQSMKARMGIGEMPPPNETTIVNNDFVILITTRLEVLFRVNSLIAYR